jgi:hypothetical protein
MFNRGKLFLFEPKITAKTTSKVFTIRIIGDFAQIYLDNIERMDNPNRKNGQSNLYFVHLKYKFNFV